MPQPNQEPVATALNPTDVILGDQDTGAVDQNGNKIYATKGFPGTLFGGGNGVVQLPPGTFLANPLAAGAANFGQAVTYDPAQFAIDAGGTFHAIPSFADNLTAQGSSQGNATQLAALVNVLTTVALNTGARLGAALVGQVIEVWNMGANALAVYPPSGGVINALSTNAGVNIQPGSVLHFRCRNATVGAMSFLAG
jgi:hypothetical protein